MSKLFINESEVSQIHKMYLIEGESDKQDGTNMRASQGFWDLIKFEEGDPKKPIGNTKHRIQAQLGEFGLCNLHCFSNLIPSNHSVPNARTNHCQK